MSARHISNPLKNSFGFSLTEALIGVGMITAIAFLVAKFSSESPTTSNRPIQARTCEAIAQGVVDAVKSRGVYKEIYHLTPMGSSRTANGISLEANPLVTNLWPGAASVYNVNNRTTNYGSNGDGEKEVSAAGFALVDGYMRTLMTIYNTNPTAYCGTWTNNPQFTVNNLQMDTELLLGNAAPDIQIQIRPYDINTGASSCPALVRAYPPGDPNFSAFSVASGVPNTTPKSSALDGEAATDHTPGAGQNDYSSDGFNFNNRSTGETQSGADAPNQQLLSYSPAAMSGSHIGFQFYARVSYTQQGVDTSCEASQNFQYFADTSPPARPTVAISGNNTTDANYIVQSPSNRSVTVTFANGNSNETGVQLYCRDRSERLTYSTTQRAKACYIGGAASAAWTGGLPSDGGRQAIGASVTQDWVPCDQVRACGRDPSTSTALANTGGTPASGPPYRVAPIIRNTYSIPPNDACDIIIDVVAIDAAGNRSDTTVALQTRTKFKFDNSAGDASVIRRPRCIAANLLGTASRPNQGIQTAFGWWCDSSVVGGAWPTGLNGYYTTRTDGCCFRAAPNSNPAVHGNTADCTPR